MSACSVRTEFVTAGKVFYDLLIKALANVCARVCVCVLAFHFYEGWFCFVFLILIIE